jgi:hypothetical protein
MSICGFSFGKDLVKLNFPVVESVRSILPICDRFVFVVGRGDDGTRELVASIDPKVEIIDSEWSNNRVDGTVLSEEATKALRAAEATGCTWGHYIQADEVVHEDDLQKITFACDRWAEQGEVKALLFGYLHFVLDYQTTDPWMYHKASRVVRLDGTCEIIGDACGPAMRDYRGKVGNGDGYLDKNFLGSHVRWAKLDRTGPRLDPDRRRGTAVTSPATIFHYGWVKTREQLEAKFETVRKLWWGTLDEQERRRRESNKFGRFFDRYPILKNYTGSHPAVMADRIAEHAPYAARRNRWLNPRFYAEVLRHGFHG